MPLRVGDTFFMANTGGANNPAGAHLMVCIARTPEAMTVIVPIVSVREGSDLSCVLRVGDHPFIKHESCAAYNFARVIPIGAIEADIANGLIVLQAPLSSDVIVRFQVGLVSSDELEPWVYEAVHGDKLKAFLRYRGHL